VGVLHGDGGVVHQNSHRQRQTAQRHQIDGLTQRRSNVAIELSTASGMDSAMMNVLRHEPK